MNGICSFRFESMPSLWRSYWKILTARKSRRVEGGHMVPRLEAVLPVAQISQAHLARYRKVCGIPPSDILPIAYPHILAMPLQMSILTCSAFPVNIAGFVHIRSSILQIRPMPNDARGELRTWIKGHREAEFGQEFDLFTEFRANHQPVWSEVCTYLARRTTRRDRTKIRDAREASLPSHPQSDTAKASRFRIESGLGMRYAWVSGDFNPIHLTDLSARAFGFDRAIIQGMWSLARCAAALNAGALRRPCELNVQFKSPVRLPSDLVLYTWDIEAGEAFALRNSQNQRAYLVGTISFDTKY